MAEHPGDAGSSSGCRNPTGTPRRRQEPHGHPQEKAGCSCVPRGHREASSEREVRLQWDGAGLGGEISAAAAAWSTEHQDGDVAAPGSSSGLSLCSVLSCLPTHPHTRCCTSESQVFREPRLALGSFPGCTALPCPTSLVPAALFQARSFKVTFSTTEFFFFFKAPRRDLTAWSPA